MGLYSIIHKMKFLHILHKIFISGGYIFWLAVSLLLIFNVYHYFFDKITIRLPEGYSISASSGNMKTSTIYNDSGKKLITGNLVFGTCGPFIYGMDSNADNNYFLINTRDKNIILLSSLPASFLGKRMAGIEQITDRFNGDIRRISFKSCE